MNGVGGSGSSSITCQSEDDFEEFGSSKGAHYLGYSATGQATTSTSAAGQSTTASSTAAAAAPAGPSTSAPTSNQASFSGGNQRVTCCLLDDTRRCHRLAGNASYSKRIQKTVYYKRLRLEADSSSPHTYICDYHKMVIQSARSRQKKDSDDDPNDGDDLADVDLYQLQVNTLRRYKKHYKISSRPGLNKAQLAEILTKHFKSLPVIEKEAITYFIYMVKAERNKLDSNRQPQGDGIGGSYHGHGGGDYLDRY